MKSVFVNKKGENCYLYENKSGESLDLGRGKKRKENTTIARPHLDRKKKKRSERRKEGLLPAESDSGVR